MTYDYQSVNNHFQRIALEKLSNVKFAMNNGSKKLTCLQKDSDWVLRDVLAINLNISTNEYESLVCLMSNQMTDPGTMIGTDGPLIAMAHSGY